MKSVKHPGAKESLGGPQECVSASPTPAKQKKSTAESVFLNVFDLF